MDFITQNFPWLAGVGTVLTLGWNYTKQIIFYLRNILVRTVNIDLEKGSPYISSYSCFLVSRSYFKKVLKFDDTIALESTYWNGERYRYSLSSPKFYIGLTTYNLPVIVKFSGNGISFTFLRGSFQVEETIKQFENYSISFESSLNKSSRFRIINKYGKINEKITVNSTKDQEVPELTVNSQEDKRLSLICDNGFFITGKNILTELCEKSQISNGIDFEMYSDEIISKVNMLKHWVDNKKWFTDRSIPWSRSIRVEGVPGSGKSTFIVDLAKYLNLPIYKFHLTTMDSKDFQEGWQNVANNSPAIILLEDFDRLFDENQSFKLDKLSLDTVLNAISGANEYNGVLTIITANFPERLDPALGQVVNGKSTRPGRLDFLIEINELSEKARYIIANKILDTFPELIKETVDLGKNETASQFSQRCIELAQKKFYEQHFQ